MSINVIEEMYGQIINKIVGEVGSKELNFISDKYSFRFYHQQDCCECVSIEDIIGDLDDLIGSPIVLAEEIDDDNESKPEGCFNDSYTWTFYRFGTVKGIVIVRWLGVFNGYYSESVDFSVLTL